MFGKKRGRLLELGCSTIMAKPPIHPDTLIFFCFTFYVKVLVLCSVIQAVCTNFAVSQLPNLLRLRKGLRARRSPLLSCSCLCCNTVSVCLPKKLLGKTDNLPVVSEHVFWLIKMLECCLLIPPHKIIHCKI